MGVYNFNPINALYPVQSTTYECNFCRCNPFSDHSTRSKYYCTIDIRKNNIMTEEFFYDKQEYLIHAVAQTNSELIVVRKYEPGVYYNNLLKFNKNDNLNYYELREKIENLLLFL